MFRVIYGPFGLLNKNEDRHTQKLLPNAKLTGKKTKPGHTENGLFGVVFASKVM